MIGWEIRRSWCHATGAPQYEIREIEDVMSPTERTLDYLRNELGMVAGVVEHWNHYTRTRHDLYGWIDIVAMSADRGVVGVQATSGANVAARLAKIRSLDTHRQWLEAGGRIWVIGWRKYKKPVNRKLWRPRIVELLASEEVELEEAA